MKTKKEMKEKAQDILMDCIATANYRVYEEFPELTDEQKDELMAEVKKQADRIAKMFGYEESWQN